MKTITTLFIIFAIGIVTAKAQTDTKIGSYLAYGTEIESIGIGVNAEFPILEKLTIAPSFTYFIPKEEGFVKINWFEFNANANYYILEQDNLSIYGIGGLNYSSIKVKFDGEDNPFFNDESASDGRIGLNLGGGINFNIGSKIEPFAELKYVIIDGGQLVIAAGVKYAL